MVIAISAYSNNTYVYSSKTVYSYFGSVISGTELQNLMEKYGIQQTGDSEKDIRALYYAMYADAANQVKESQASSTANNKSIGNQSNEAPNPANVPWANLMNQVGLNAIGDLATDYEAFKNKISAMQASGAASAQTQAAISQLIAEASIVFVQQTGSSGQSSSSSAQGSQAAPSGADITAQLNRLLMVS